jgi:hypothetical protein
LDEFFNKKETLKLEVEIDRAAITENLSSLVESAEFLE